jgi:hypothetical protein
VQATVSDFTNVMSWLVLGLGSIVVLLLVLEAWHLQEHRRRAFFGLMSMALVLVATAMSLLLLAAHHSQQGSPFLSQLLLPLTASVLLVGLSRLAFPSSASAHPSHMQYFLLLLLIGMTIVGASGLVVFDLLFA